MRKWKMRVSKRNLSSHHGSRNTALPRLRRSLIKLRLSLPSARVSLPVRSLIWCSMAHPGRVRPPLSLHCRRNYSVMSSLSRESLNLTHQMSAVLLLSERKLRSLLKGKSLDIQMAALISLPSRSASSMRQTQWQAMPRQPSVASSSSSLPQPVSASSAITSARLLTLLLRDVSSSASLRSLKKRRWSVSSSYVSAKE